MINNDLVEFGPLICVMVPSWSELLCVCWFCRFYLQPPHRSNFFGFNHILKTSVLVDDLQKVSMKPTPKWKVEFDNYLRAMPGYYASVSSLVSLISL